MMENLDDSNIFPAIQKIKGTSEQKDEMLNRYLEDNKLTIVKELLKECVYYKDVSEEEINGYAETLTIMIDELLQDENQRYIDIQYLKSGQFSQAYQIGEKVIKIGMPRATYYIPNHRRILQPLARKEFKEKKRNNRVFACAEIVDLVNPLRPEDWKEETLYQVYKDLREDGLVWTDIKYDNLGRLRRKNVVTFEGKEIWVAPEAVGFIDEDPKDEHQEKYQKDKTILEGRQKENVLSSGLEEFSVEDDNEEHLLGEQEKDLAKDTQKEGRRNQRKLPLEAGDLVILDSDFIYKDSDPNIVWADERVKKFEQRYQQEVQDEEIREFRQQILKLEGESYTEKQSNTEDNERE